MDHSSQRRGTLIDTKNGKIYTTVPSQPPQPLTKLQSYQIQVDLARCRGQWKLLQSRLLPKLKKYQQLERLASTGIVGPGQLVDVVSVECQIGPMKFFSNYDLDLQQLVLSNNPVLYKCRNDLLKLISVPQQPPQIPEPLVLTTPLPPPSTLLVTQQAQILLGRIEMAMGNPGQCVATLAPILTFLPPSRDQVVELSYYSSDIPPTIIGWTAYQRILVIQGWTILATAYFFLGHHQWAKGLLDKVIEFYDTEILQVFGQATPIPNGILLAGGSNPVASLSPQPNPRERNGSVASIFTTPSVNATSQQLNSMTISSNPSDSHEFHRSTTLDLAATQPFAPILAPSAVANSYQQSITTGILSYSTGTSGMSTKAVQAYSNDPGTGDQLVRWTEDAYWRRCVIEMLPNSASSPTDEEIPLDQRLIQGYFDRFPVTQTTVEIAPRIIPLVESRLWFLVSRGVRMDKIEAFDWDNDGWDDDAQEDLEEEDDLLSIQGITGRLCPRFLAPQAWFTQGLSLMEIYEQMTTSLAPFPQANQGITYSEDSIVDRFGGSPVFTGNDLAPTLPLPTKEDKKKRLKRIQVSPKDAKDATKKMFKTISGHILGDLLDKNRRVISNIGGVVDPTSPAARRLKRVQDLYEIWGSLVLGRCHHALADRHGVGLSTVGALAQGNVWYSDDTMSNVSGSTRILGVIPPGSVVLEDDRITYARLNQLLSVYARSTTHTFAHLPLIRCILHVWTTMIHSVPDSMTHLDLQECQRWWSLYLELWNTGWKRRKESERKKKEDELLLKIRASNTSIASDELKPPSTRQRSLSDSSVTSNIHVSDSDVPCWTLTNGETLDDHLGVHLAIARWHLLPFSNFVMGDESKILKIYHQLKDTVSLLEENRLACPRGLRFVDRCVTQGYLFLGMLCLEYAMQTTSIDEKSIHLTHANSHLNRAIWGMRRGIEADNIPEAPSTLDLNSLDLRDDAWEPLHHLALVQWELGRRNLAISILQKSLLLNPNVTASWNLMILLLSSSDDGPSTLPKAQALLDTAWKELVVNPASLQLSNPPPNVEYQWNSIDARDKSQLINLKITSVWVVRAMEGPLCGLQHLQSALALFSRMFPGMLESMGEQIDLHAPLPASGYATLKRMQNTVKEMTLKTNPNLQHLHGRNDSVGSLPLSVSSQASATRSVSPSRPSLGRSSSPSKGIQVNSVPFPTSTPATSPSPPPKDATTTQALQSKPIYHFAPHHHLLSLWLTACHFYRDLGMYQDSFACIQEARNVLERICACEVEREVGGSGVESVVLNQPITSTSIGAKTKLWGTRSKRVLRCLLDVEVAESIILLFQRHQQLSAQKPTTDPLSRYQTTDVTPMDKVLTESSSGLSRKKTMMEKRESFNVNQAVFYALQGKLSDLNSQLLDPMQMGRLDYHFKQPTQLPQLTPQDPLLDVLIEHLHTCSLLLDSHGPLRCVLGHLYYCKQDWAMAEFWLDRVTSRQASATSGNGDASCLGGNWWISEAWGLLSRVMWKTGRIHGSLECLEWSKKTLVTKPVRGVEVLERIAW